MITIYCGTVNFFGTFGAGMESGRDQVRFVQYTDSPVPRTGTLELYEFSRQYPYPLCQTTFFCCGSAPVVRYFPYVFLLRTCEKRATYLIHRQFIDINKIHAKKSQEQKGNKFG